MTPTVFVKRLPLYVYYTTADNIGKKMDRRLYLKVTKVTNNYRRGANAAAFFDPDGFKKSNTYEPAC